MILLAKTDYIDLFWLHAWDFTTPVEEVMRSLDDMVRQGKLVSSVSFKIT
ncbi:aldo/keto reductase [Nostoc sp. T09]